jgi:hypothetical protein
VLSLSADMDLSAIGWREAALLAVVVVAGYLGYALMRLSQLKAQSSTPSAAPQQAQPASSFGEQQFIRGVQAELEQMHAEIAALREELGKLKTARMMSPQYADAVTLAEQGADARSIAERCSISVGEAELVLALTRKPEE